MELLLLCTPCVILLLSSLYLLRLFVDARRNLPPGPRPLPLIGNILDLGSQPHRSLARLAGRYGPLMTLRLGTVTTVVASSPGAARDILQRHDAAFSARSVPDAARACGHDGFSMGMLPPSSALWRALRRVCAAELFAPRSLDAHQRLRRDKVRQLVSHVARLARDGAAVDFGRAAFTASLNLLSSTIFSADLADFGDARAESSVGDLRDLISEFTIVVGVPNVSDFFPGVAPLDPQRLRRRVARVFERLQAVFDGHIERRLRDRAAGEPPKNDFLDALLDYRSPEDGRGFDRPTLQFLFTDLFSAGSDTSAVTVEWAMAQLLQNPPTMAKAREELARVIGSKQEIEESDISQLKYLEAVVKETLRLHPPAPFLLPHQAETTTQVGGYTVPKGTRVLVNVWAIGRDSKVWSDPDKFMPERFLQSEVDLRGRDFELIPFGSGRRICPGLPLAVRMVHLMLASLLHRFEWRLLPEVEKNGVDMAEKFGMILELATPLRAVAIPV
uniref:Cytochrome P450 n=1 Tax=Oryza meridionalis TaxID=40149 RepID=A0A0E0CY10_9ORYZ